MLSAIERALAFSTDTLIDVLARLGVRVRLVTRPSDPSRVA